MFVPAGFKFEWQTDATAGLVSRRAGVPRVDLLAHGALIRFALPVGQEVAAQEVAKGQRYELSRKALAVVGDTGAREALSPIAIPPELVPDCDGTEITVQLDAMPESDFLPLSLDLPAGSLLWFQPAPTQAEYEEGYRRSGLALNSIAVYGPADGGTGRQAKVKLGHLWRPWVLDANGEYEWCDWVLTGPNQIGGLRLPMEWLQSDHRAWPVLCGPNFGKTDIGASSFALATGLDFAMQCIDTPASDGTLTTYQGYLDVTTARNTVFGLYEETAGRPNARLDVVGQQSIGGPSAGWKSVASGALAITAGKQYAIGLAFEASTNCRYDSGYNYSRVSKTYDGSLLSPYPDPYYFQFIYSFYCEYTATASASGPDMRRVHHHQDRQRRAG